MEIRQMQKKDSKIRLRFTVSDTGIGMSSAFEERLFVPFEQADISMGQNAGGTGLGMPITKNLVTLMGGTITLQSELGKGTSFAVELDFDLPKDKGSQTSAKQYVMESLKVLVTDDDRDSCVHTAILLENLGIRSDWVLTGRECINRVCLAHRSGEDYDVCLIDLRMPDMDGVQVTRRIREIVGSETMIIIITAYDWGAVENSARQAGANAFITKPIFASTLYDTLLSVTGIERAVRPPGGTARRAGLAGHHVLLVEDNGLNREIAVELLNMADITVECAVNGREAVERFLSHGDSFDLILMDVQMPVMDGYEATQAIRGSDHEMARSIPIIAMTADAFHEDVVRAGEAGMNGHLAKPIDPNLLYDMLAGWMGGHFH